MPEKKDKPYYYRAVPGSRDLVTRALEDDDELAAFETIAESGKAGEGEEPRSLEYNGETLGPVTPDSGVTVPFSVFDDVALDLSALEQSVYLHLFRLSRGAGVNFCRVGKKELASRSRLTDRRLNVALDGLVRKGHIKPLHRSVKGTLYRVFLPHEEPAAELPAKEIEAPAPIEEKSVEVKRKEAGAPIPRREKPLESPLNEESFSDLSGRGVKGPGLAELADRFFELKNQKPGVRARQVAMTVITELLEDGFSRTEIYQAIEWYAANLPEESSLERLPYYVAAALKGS